MALFPVEEDRLYLLFISTTFNIPYSNPKEGGCHIMSERTSCSGTFGSHIPIANAETFSSSVGANFRSWAVDPTVASDNVDLRPVLLLAGAGEGNEVGAIWAHVIIGGISVRDVPLCGAFGCTSPFLSASALDTLCM